MIGQTLDQVEEVLEFIDGHHKTVPREALKALAALDKLAPAIQKSIGSRIAHAFGVEGAEKFGEFMDSYLAVCRERENLAGKKEGELHFADFYNLFKSLNEFHQLAGSNPDFQKALVAEANALFRKNQDILENSLSSLSGFAILTDSLRTVSKEATAPERDFKTLPWFGVVTSQRRNLPVAEQDRTR